MSEIHKLVRARLARNAAEVRVRLELARAQERTLPMKAEQAKIRTAREIRELRAQLESWVTLMALARVPEELRGDGS